jgi:transposase
MANKSQQMEVTDEQRKELTVMSQSLKLEHRYVVRFKVILLSLKGKPLDFIIQDTGLSRKVVNKWRQRLKKLDIAGLKDAQRPGQNTYH